MKLTMMVVKNAKPKKKAYKLFDGAGLYLLVSKTGRKYWRYDYRYVGKYKTLALGAYPDVSLKKAREEHRQARLVVESGSCPVYERKVEKTLKLTQAGNSFKAVALEWLEKQKVTWVESHYRTVDSRLNNYVFPAIGDRPIAEIKAPELLAMLRKIEHKKAYETAHRIRSVCGQVLRYAIVTGRAECDVAADLKGALIAVPEKHFAAITNPVEVGGLLRAIDEYTGDMVTKCALKLAPLTFVRPGELRHAEWSEINIDRAEWIIPAEKMKMRVEHIVPLSKQAIAVLEDMRPLTGIGIGKYIFPSIRTRMRPMSDNTVNAALRRMGYRKDEMTGHGFRSMASTLLNEQGFNIDWIELQLAHSERNKVRAAYNRARYLPQRTRMMQKWADYLDTLRCGRSADVIPISRRG